MPRPLTLPAILLLALLGSGVLLGGAAEAADPQPPIGYHLPGGQGVTITTNPPGIVGQTGLKDSPAGKVPDTVLDLILVRCGYQVAGDGTVWCGVGAKPGTPTGPGSGPTTGPTSGPTSGPSGTPTGAPAGGGNGHGAGHDTGQGHGSAPGSPAGDGGALANGGAGDDANGSGSDGANGTGSAGGDASGDGSGAGSAGAGSGAGDGSGAQAGGAASAHAGGGRGGGHGGGPAEAAPLSAHRTLRVGVTAFSLLALIGSAGLAAASSRTWRQRYPKVKEKSQGSVLTPDDGMYEFDPELAGPGDRSRWWRFLTGWVVVDRLSRLVPTGLSLRAPLLARISADASYLRAILGAAWAVLPVAGFACGLSAAHQTDGYPVAPGMALTIALLGIAVLDAAAGFASVLGFTLGLLVWGPGDLGFATGLRSYLGLAALWFAIPLIASTARPLRRTQEETALHRWDRLADGVIAALVAGWAVQGAVLGLPGLSGRVSPIDTHADALALVAIAAVLLRVGLEEIATLLFPERLKVVDTGMLPEPSLARSVVSAFLRTAVFLFIAEPFIGNCWQLWVGGAIFLVPSLLGLAADGFPNSEGLFRVLPRGVAMVLFMLLVGLAFAKLVESATTTGTHAVQNGFVLLALPGLVISLVSMVGREGPVPHRGWHLELLGAVVVAASVAIVVGV